METAEPILLKVVMNMKRHQDNSQWMMQTLPHYHGLVCQQQPMPDHGLRLLVEWTTGARHSHSYTYG